MRTQLQRSSVMTTSALAKRLNRVESRGLVLRQPNAPDGHVNDVGLTDAGIHLIEKSLPDHLRNGRQLLVRLSICQRKALAVLLTQLFDWMGMVAPTSKDQLTCRS